MNKLSPSQIVASDDYASFPAIAAALADLDKATNPAERDAARDALRRGELERDIALGFTDLWSAAERERAHALGLI